MTDGPLVERLRGIVGAEHVVTHQRQLATYESDGLLQYAVTPAAVVLPGTAAEVAGVVRACHEAEVPWVARGAGSGLSGGALPVEDGILIALSRLRRILEVDIPNGRVLVEPGVTNIAVSQAVAPTHFFPPDPSSQIVCTIGGNVAENSGGAHCLKYGFTVNHVRGVRLVTASGEVVDIGGPVLDPPGYDLLGVVVGSEGTLGIVTEVVLRILRKPEATRTFFATFPSTDEAGVCVSEIIGAGIVPAAIEMMDRLAIKAAVQWFVSVGGSFDIKFGWVSARAGPIVEVAPAMASSGHSEAAMALSRGMSGPRTKLPPGQRWRERRLPRACWDRRT